MGALNLDQFFSIFSGKKESISSRLTRKGDTSVRKINKMHDLNLSLRIDIKCIDSASSNVNDRKKVDTLFHTTYFAPIESAVSELLKSSSSEVQKSILEQFETIEILPNDGKAYNVKFDSGTLQLRKNFSPFVGMSGKSVQQVSLAIKKAITDQLVVSL